MSDRWADDLYVLWDRIGERASADVGAAATELMRSVSDWLHAQHAAWVGSVRLSTGPEAERDAMLGWRARAVLTEPPPSAAESELTRLWLAERRQSSDPGATTTETVRGAGRFRVHQLRDGFVNFAAFEATGHYDLYYRRLEVRDRIWIAAPVSADAEAVYFFDRRGADAKPFSSNDVRLAGQAIRGLTWFHRLLMCGHGLLAAQTPLTPTERRVLSQLLTDKSEREIADSLAQSPHTTHHHVREIYRKLGVSSRTALMAAWLNTA